MEHFGEMNINSLRGDFTDSFLIRGKYSDDSYIENIQKFNQNRIACLDIEKQNKLSLNNYISIVKK